MKQTNVMALDDSVKLLNRDAVHRSWNLSNPFLYFNTVV